MSADDEFKIDEPPMPKGSFNEIREKVRRAKLSELAMKCSHIVLKEDLDADNMFHISKPKVGINVCVLAESIPCKNPHCTTCNLVLINGDEAEKIQNYVSHYCAEKQLEETKSKIGKKEQEWLDHMIEVIRQHVEGDE